MATKAQIARLATDEKLAARQNALAAALRDTAQAKYDALVEEQQQIVQAHVAGLKEIEDSAESAQAAVELATTTLTEVARVLKGAREDVAAIAARRQAITGSHVDDVRDLATQIADLAPQLAIEFWTDAAAAQLATEVATS